MPRRATAGGDLAFHVLGPVRASRRAGDLALGGPRQRLVLALLLVEPGRSRGIDALVSGVWGDAPPATARKTLQGYVHHLRAALGDAAIVTDGTGYRLAVDPQQVDAARFERLAATGRAQLGDRPDRAAELLGQALGLWSGRAYEDLDEAVALAPEIRRLDELRMGTLGDRIEAELAGPATPALVGELQGLALEYPLRERLHGLLMLALYRSGQPSEALQVHERLRRRLAVELGVDPSPDLQELHRRILRHDPTLRAGRAPRPSRTRGLSGYELHELVGTGPLGTVHRGYQTSLGRTVALKVLRADVADDPTLVATFTSSVGRVAALDHPNVVPVLDAWREPGAAHLVRPWLADGSLGDRLAEGPLPTDRLVSVMRDVAAGLAHAHARGVVHGRLKPTNVLFDGDGRARIVDFHLDGAQPVGPDAARRWLAPEVTTGRGPSPASDVYGLAALVRAMATGPPAQRDPTGSDPADAIEPSLAAAIAAPLDRRVSRRPSDVAVVAATIAGALGHPLPADDGVGTVRARTDLRNPFKGLRAFDEVDAGDFFGRADLVDRIVDRLSTHRLVTVVGPSGSGKSSVVRAGVLPRLRGDDELGGAGLLVASLFPGADPFAELARALVRVAVTRPADLAHDLARDDDGLLAIADRILPDAGAGLLLVIDQFEELFTLVEDAAVRRRFLSTLRTAVTEPASRIRVLLTLRADFYDQPLQSHDFGQLVEAGTVAVTPPSPDDLATAITGPAELVGLDVEAGLVPEVVRDVTDQPGGLPLLQYTLTELVERREADRLTIAGYRRAGRVTGALAGHAEELWEDLTPTGRDALRQALLRMVTVDDTGDGIRRRVRRSELTSLPVQHSELARALTRFGDHRLLSFDRDPVTRGPTVEVAHEALLREWPRMRGWIAEQRENLLLSRRLSADLQEWIAAGRGEGWLLRDERLDRFAAWGDAGDLALTRPEREFLEASRALRDREHRADQDAARRLRRLLAIVSTLALLAVAAGAVAWLQAGRAADQAAAATASRADAETRRLALQAPQLVDSDRQVAILLALEALDRDPGPVSVGALQSVLVASPRWLGHRALARSSIDVAFARGDDVVALASSGIEVFRGPGMEPDFTVPAAGAELMAVSAEAGLVAVADASGVWVTDLATGDDRSDLTGDPGARVTALAFDGSGGLLAVGEAGGLVRVHDLATGRVRHEIVAHPEDSMAGIETPPHQPANARFGTQAVAFDRDGTRLVTGGLVSGRVWDLATGERLDDVRLTRALGDGRRVPAPVDAVAFADGSDDTILLASVFNVVPHRIGSADLDLTAERPFPARENAQGGDRTLASVWLAGDLAILGERGGGVTVMPLTDDAPIQTLDAQATGAPRVAVSADRDVLLYAGDEDASRWSLEGHSLVSHRLPAEGRRDAQWSADGATLALNSTDLRLPVVWELQQAPGGGSSATTYHRVPVPEDFDGHYAFLGPDRWMVSVDLDGQRLLAHDTRELAADAIVLSDAIGDAVAFSDDGRYVAWHASDLDTPPTVSVFDLDRGELVADRLDDLVQGDNWAVPKLAFSPDATRLVATGTAGEAVVWDTASWTATWISQGGGAVLSAGFTPDGRGLVTMSQAGRIVVRDPDTLQPDGPPLLGQTDGMDALNMGPEFAPDGRWMVTTADGSGRLWDLHSRTLVGEPFPSDPDSQPNASPDARRLATFDGDDVVVWDLDVDRWPDLACAAAGRNLTRQEWDQFGPRDAPYRPTCTQFPADEPDEEHTDE